MASLPAEIIYAVVESLVPRRSHIAYPQSHPITKTLLSCTVAAKSIHATAIRLLYSNCLYIDTFRRLKLLVKALTASSSTQPFSILNVLVMSDVKSLYLAPYPCDKWGYSTLNHPRRAVLTKQLLNILAPSLTRLVVDIPLRSLYPERDHHNLRPYLRDGFLGLTSLEEFTSARDELYLDLNQRWIVDDPQCPVWSQWPRLRHLALYNVDLDNIIFQQAIARMEDLTCLALTRADASPSGYTKLADHVRRPCLLLNINTAHGHQSRRWDADPEDITPDIDGNETVIRSGNSWLRMINVVVPNPPYGHSPLLQHEDIETSQVWTRDKAISRELWHDSTDQASIDV